MSCVTSSPPLSHSQFITHALSIGFLKYLDYVEYTIAGTRPEIDLKTLWLAKPLYCFSIAERQINHMDVIPDS